MFYFKAIVLLWLLNVFLPPAWGQSDAQILGFHFKKPTYQQWKIPFQQHNNLIVIPLTVNGSYDTLNFVLDTGVGHTLITDPSVKEKFKLTCFRNIKISGFGKEEALNGCVVQLKEIGLGKKVGAFNHHVVILDKDVLDLSSYAGVRIHGLIGHDLFSRFVVKIDYLSQRITLTQPDIFVQKNKKIKKTTQVLPISIEEMKPYILAQAWTQGDSTQYADVKLLLDTGAGHSLSLDVGTHPLITIPKKHLPAELGITLNGTVEGAIARIERLKVGKVSFDKVITTFPDSASVANRLVISTIARQGNIGCGILNRFHLTFDYSHKQLYLTPNRYFKDPFEFNTSGIELSASPPYYKDVKIGGVRINSPAYRAGLRSGDKIMAIDEHLTLNKRLGEIYKLINQKAGKKIALLVEFPEGGFQVVELLLENPI